MGLLGISLLVASVVYVIIRPPGWLAQRLSQWRGSGDTIADSPTPTRQQRIDDDTTPLPETERPEINPPPPTDAIAKQSSPSESKRLKDAAAMPPPPPLIVQPPTTDEPDGSTTPKASAAAPPAIPVPRLSLSSEPLLPLQLLSSEMPPPPLPRQLRAARTPAMPRFPAPDSAQRARGPVPNRGPPGGLSLPTGRLAPPPTHSAKPPRPSQKVLLDPGHSPLDWARISGSGADLRGVEPSTPYLRVTPSMLRKQTGRKGKDAWMALNGKVYNITPYAKFHPGGVPELLRGAARDGTKLFGEIHPWVNYENMLAACLVGLLVEEPEKEKIPLSI
ncbi:Cytochrome b5 [Metarhizium rileyi]|uniref:Cytochrome b5 n=1 Tax=Metarhizium rileyi (strain RCEF 4871) TaxID=1649241 RepID=A0A167HFS0_METRR|nr:Cytochrome b5 [Metarhizium rileyi RCEF 4871]